MFTVTYFKGKYKHYVGIACYVCTIEKKITLILCLKSPVQ